MNKIYSDYKKGIYVTSNNIQYFIDDKDKNKNIVLELIGIFNVKNIYNNKIINTIKSIIKIDIIYNKDKDIYELPGLGIISWT
jgi:hypothetical protein